MNTDTQLRKHSCCVLLGCDTVCPGMWVPAFWRNMRLQGIETDEAVCSSGTR